LGASGVMVAFSAPGLEESAVKTACVGAGGVGGALAWASIALDAGLTFGSGPWSLEDGKLNDWNGGRGFYFKDPDGHVIELMTVPQ